MNGWIRLYRQLLDSPVFENEKALKIWIWCLLKATHTEREQLVGLQVVKLEKGQLIFGRKKASEELNINENTIYKYIKMLEQLEMITTNSNTKFTIITIRKWEEYQYISEEGITTEEQQNNNKVTAKEQQNNTNKNVKNDKNVKNVRNNNSKFIPPTVEEISQYVLEKKLNVSAQQFYDYFSTGDWIDSKGNKVKNWKQKILTWNKYAKPKEINNETGNPFFDLLREEGKM